MPFAAGGTGAVSRLYSPLSTQEGMGVVDLQWIEGGGIATPRGFRAGGVYAGIRTYGEEPRFDVGILVSDFPCAVGGIFTTNAFPGEPVKLDRARVATGRARAIVANSGNA